MTGLPSASRAALKAGMAGAQLSRRAEGVRAHRAVVPAGHVEGGQQRPSPMNLRIWPLKASTGAAIASR